MTPSEQATQPAVDVGVLLEQLRAEVRARRQLQGSPADDPLQRELQRALDEIELHRVVSAHWPLIGHSLPTRLIALVNKLVRRYLRWYINPIVEQQNAYNEVVARTLRLLAEAYADLAAQVPDGTPPATGSVSLGQHGTPTLGALAAEQAQRAVAEPPAAFPDLELRAQELQLKLRQNVSAHWPLNGRSMPEKAIALVNKLVRRYLRWYINPIVEQQNAANTAMTAALLAVVRLDAERRAGAAARRARSRRSAGRSQNTVLASDS